MFFSFSRCDSSTTLMVGSSLSMIDSLSGVEELCVGERMLSSSSYLFFGVGCGVAIF